jgi:ABC-type uncharacterized transport system permease subunit
MKWWISVFTMEARKILAYRSDFWVIFIGQTAIQLLLATALWRAVFESQGTSEMNGYTLPMMTLYYLISPIGSRMMSGESMGFVSREIYDGAFTRYLIYPLSFIQYKSLTYLAHTTFYAIQLSLIYVLYHLIWTQNPIGWEDLALGLGMFFLSALTFLNLAMFVELLALWADNIWSIMAMVRFSTSFLGGATIPIAFFPESAQVILKYMPFPYLIGLPIRTVMGLSTQKEILQGCLMLLIWAVVFRISVMLLWGRGQKLYTGVGI